MYKATRYLYTAKKNADGTIVYLVDGLELDAEDFAYPGTPLEEEMIPYIERALAGENVYSQKIIDTTWGHIFTACYLVKNETSGEVIGALCMEMDMEPTYETIEKNNSAAIKVAVIVGVLAVCTIVWAYYSFQEQKRKDQEQKRVLAETAAAADAANKAKSTFLFNMSHDLRTPMNAILGYSDLARKHLTEPEKLNNYMDNIRVSGEKLLSTVNSILELERIENNEIVIEENVHDTGEIMDSCVAMFHNALEEKKQTMTVEKHILYPYIYLDSAHVSDICINIIGNAVKYTGNGGKIRCEMWQRPLEKEGWCEVEIQITDNGIGISEEFQERMFDAFSREQSATVSGIEGTGLGMGIVKKLVDLMNGVIEVESKVGKGTRFTVKIPCRITSEDESKLKKVSCHLKPASAEGRRILLAEDNDLNAGIATELLAEEGLQTDRAKDGVECVEMLEKAEAGTYDMILMDIQMPVMDGNKATRTIQSLENPEKAGIPIVAMTANAFTEDRERALAAGMNGHVAKPIDMNQLLLILKEEIGVQVEVR